MELKDLISVMLVPVAFGGYMFTWLTHNRLLDRIDFICNKLTELQFNHISHLETRIKDLESAKDS